MDPRSEAICNILGTVVGIAVSICALTLTPRQCGWTFFVSCWILGGLLSYAVFKAFIPKEARKQIDIWSPQIIISMLIVWPINLSRTIVGHSFLLYLRLTKRGK